VPEDPVTLERGRPVTDTELLRRADWIRRQAVDLIAQAGLGHYYGLTVSSVVVRALELVKASGRSVKPRSVPPVKSSPYDGR
jgi:transketolase N-terminal domain/subunit